MNALTKYACSKCGVVGVKLWRQTGVSANEIELLCANCDTDKSSLVPAIPDRRPDGDGSLPDNTHYWGASSVPSSGVLWWNTLREYGVLQAGALQALEAECVRLEGVEAREKAQREAHQDQHFSDLFAKTECVVEATSCEKLFLWERHAEHGSVRWHEETAGWFTKVGELAGRPVCLSLTWACLGIPGVWVLFWEATSKVTDSEMGEAWLESMTPGAEVRTNAGNFHLVLRHARCIS